MGSRGTLLPSKACDATAYNAEADRLSYKISFPVIENFQRDGTIRENKRRTRSLSPQLNRISDELIGFGWTNAASSNCFTPCAKDACGKLEKEARARRRRQN